jgi:hypothetical protein
VSAARTWTVLLWGDTQVGKTTLLTTALYARQEGRLADLVDRTRSAPALASTLLPHWRRLSRSLWTQPTAQDFIDIPLITNSGNTLRLRDVRGGLSRQLEDPVVLRELTAAAPDAYLFMLEWGTRDLNNQLLAVTASLDLCGDRPRGLVFTKCERAFDEGDRCWRGGPGWWRTHPALLPHAHVLDGFGDAVWPCSAYGYHQRLGQPALLLGEFGQLMPFEIQPVGVNDPFDWVLDRLGVA